MSAGRRQADESNLGLRVFSIVEAARAAQRTVTVEFTLEQTKHALRLAALRAAGIENTGTDITVTQSPAGTVVRIVYDLPPAATPAPAPLLVAAPSAPPPKCAAIWYEFSVYGSSTTVWGHGSTVNEAIVDACARCDGDALDVRFVHVCTSVDSPAGVALTPMHYEFAIFPFPMTYTAWGLTEDEAWDTVWRRLNSAQRDQMVGHKCVGLSRNPIAPAPAPKD